MNHDALSEHLDKLVATCENEVVEFKQAGNDYDSDRIGRYFSALANEANLGGHECAWLIFGIDNKTRSVVGSSYRPDPERLQSTKMQITESTEPAVTFRNIYELMHGNGRVIMFEIPAAPCGLPIAWKGHYYARAGESLVALGVDKLDEIRQQTQRSDWTAQIVDAASVNHLDDEFYCKLTTDFIEKFGHASREDIDKLLVDKLSDTLDATQKKNKIANLLTKMRRKNQIVNTGSRTAPCWVIAERDAE